MTLRHDGVGVLTQICSGNLLQINVVTWLSWLKNMPYVCFWYIKLFEWDMIAKFVMSLCVGMSFEHGFCDSSSVLSASMQVVAVILYRAPFSSNLVSINIVAVTEVVSLAMAPWKINKDDEEVPRIIFCHWSIPVLWKGWHVPQLIMSSFRGKFEICAQIGHVIWC